MAIYIALGANLSNGNEGPQQTFLAALQHLSVRGVKLIARSGLWQSPAWPAGAGQPDYINACVQVRTDLSPEKLLKLLHEAEAQFGRVRGARNAARTLDLDLLDYEGQIIGRGDIILPHPRMLTRGFVLFPLAEIAPHWRDPIHKRAIHDWTARLPLDDVRPLFRLGAFN